MRVVDLLDSGVEEAAAAAAAAEPVEAPSIAIPADGGANPSLILPPSTSSSPGAAHVSPRLRKTEYSTTKNSMKRKEHCK